MLDLCRKWDILLSFSAATDGWPVDDRQCPAVPGGALGILRAVAFDGRRKVEGMEEEAL